MSPMSMVSFRYPEFHLDCVFFGWIMSAGWFGLLALIMSQFHKSRSDVGSISKKHSPLGRKSKRCSVSERLNETVDLQEGTRVG